MRFNGTTVPTNRDDTYTTKETNRDIQTGRAVYADKDKYENDADYKASIDSYVKEGFHLIFGAPDNPSEGGGGGAELLIVNVSSSSPKTLDRTWQEIHDALANGIPAYLKGTDPDVSEYITLTPIWGTDQNFETNLYEVYSFGWNGDGFDRVGYASETSDGYPQGRS